MSWQDAYTNAEMIPSSLRVEVQAEAQRCLQAMADDDIGYFVDRFYAQDKWRILNHYLDRCSFFDIETTGLEYDDTITMIVCWHDGKLHTFVEHENLDDFLDLLEDVQLLISFNGSSFDVPRVLDGFHIPELPCPHIDLRWPCYHAQLHGGLKQITTQLGLQRPADLLNADGSLAIELWSRWQHTQDADARELLIRYCAADVLLMLPLAQHVAGHPMTDCTQLWKHLPQTTAVIPAPTPQEARLKELATVFGSASPGRHRTRRSRHS